MRKSFNLAVQALTVQYQGRTALNKYPRYYSLR